MEYLKIQLRVPASLRDWFAVYAARHHRSMNGQVVAMIEAAKEAEKKQEAEKHE